MRSRSCRRRGNILVLTAFILVGMLGMVAFAVDMGYVLVSRTEMQRTADAAAVAATWSLLNEDATKTAYDINTSLTRARNAAVQFTNNNPICSQVPTVDPNTPNSAAGDVVIGTLSDVTDHSLAMTYGAPSTYNAVKIKVRKDATRNGAVPYFFARILGQSSIDMYAEATAAYQSNFRGWQAPSDGGNLDLLPFALDEDTWNDLLAGGGSDNWTWNPATKTITSGADGVKEVNLYPQGTGSPGNRGTVDIGGSNNSTADIARQITDGVSPSDLSHHGGKLELDVNGELELNGDTGISAGVKDELTSIKGQPRIIPIFRTVCGPGNNAQYTIVKFCGVRIMEVKLTGPMSGKKVIIQPAMVKARGGIPDPGAQKTWYTYSQVILVQ